MDDSSILIQLNDIFTDVLNNEQIKVTPTSSAADIKEWDSLNHIQLIVAIERKFKLRFTTPELTKWKTVQDMIAAIQSKLNK